MMESRSQDNSVTLCAIMKDEYPYIVEWVAFHRVLGFENIMVFSNDCSDGSDALLDSLAAAGFLEHHRWPTGNASPQLTAYAEAVRECKTEWIGFLDADEFFNPKEADNIAQFLERFDVNVSAIAINWRIFGSAGELLKRSENVVERFTRAAPSTHHLNRHCKTIARVKDIKEAHIHRCFLSQGKYVDTRGVEIEIERMGFTPSVQHGAAQINHYVVKSAEEFEEKRRRGNANRPAGSPDKFTTRDGFYFQNHDKNEESDETVLRFLPLLIKEASKISSSLNKI
jgi:hypothetical protein